MRVATPSRQLSPRTRLAVRLVGAALLAAMGWIHWHLYDLGYSSLDVIGPLFLLNAVLGVLAAVAVLATPARWLPIVTAAGALLEAGTLGALVLSLTTGLFGFQESFAAPWIWETIAVETAGTLVLGFAAWYERDLLLRSLRRR